MAAAGGLFQHDGGGRVRKEVKCIADEGGLPRPSLYPLIRGSGAAVNHAAKSTGNSFPFFKMA